MEKTPHTKNTRSNSSVVTLSDIKNLLENTRNDILQTMTRENQRINDKLQQLLARTNELENANKDLRLQNMKLTEEVRELQRKRENEISEITEELHHRSIREQNLIFFGVPEQLEGSVADRQKCDIELCKEIVRTIGVEDHINQPMRLGRTNKNSSRPLRLKCTSFDQKQNILRRCRSLRSFEAFKYVYINPDRTPMQQAANKALREELMRRRNAGEDVYIFKGKVVEKDETQVFLTVF